jgi:hypothetical protein
VPLQLRDLLGQVRGTSYGIAESDNLYERYNRSAGVMAMTQLSRKNLEAIPALVVIPWMAGGDISKVGSHAAFPQLLDDFARMACIVPEKRDQFGASVERAIESWRTEIGLSRQIPEPGRSGKYRTVHDALREMQCCADLLIKYVERAAWAYSSVDFGWATLAFKLSPATYEGTLDLKDMLADLGKINQAITRGLDFVRIKKYPGLAELVFRLELAAQNAGGKFTAHRKVANKGSLLCALNLFRKFVEIRLGKGASERLPQPMQHPVPEYERLLKIARNDRSKT